MKKIIKIVDGLLVLRYQSGDKKALTLLVERYHPKFCRHANCYTHDRDAARDIAQDAWGIIIRKLAQLRDPDNFGSWAMRIVTRKSLDHINRQSFEREKIGMVSFGTVLDEYTGEREALVAKLYKAIRALPEEQQLVIRLFYNEEYSLKEISTILEVPAGTVKSRLYHAREKLKIVLKTY